jgi:hypothetical protein
MPYCLDNRTFLGDLYMDVVLLSPPLVVESVFCRLPPFRLPHPHRFVASATWRYIGSVISSGLAVV